MLGLQNVTCPFAQSGCAYGFYHRPGKFTFRRLRRNCSTIIAAKIRGTEITTRDEFLPKDV